MRGGVLHVLARAAGQEAADAGQGQRGLAQLLGHEDVDDGVGDGLHVRQAGEQDLATHR